MTCLLTFEYCLRVVRGLPAAGKVSVRIDGCSKIVPLASVSEFPFRHAAPNWSDVRRVAVAYFTRFDGVALPDSSPDEPVLAFDEDHIQPALAVPSRSNPAPPKPVQNGVVDWGEIPSLALLFFWPIRLF